MTSAGPDVALREPSRRELAQALEQSRASMRALLEGLADELQRQYDPEFSPIGWHWGHVAWQEECFVARKILGAPALMPELDALFDPRSSSKEQRAAELPERSVLDAYAQRVRAATLRCLAQVSFDESPLLREGHVFRFVANHELQHAEIVATIRTLGDLPLPGAPALPAEPATSTRLHVPGGEAVLGSDDDPDRWDNEQRAHRVELPQFWLGSRLVLAGEWLEFMAAGGYDDRRLWSDAGWHWRSSGGVRMPLHWQRRADGSFVRRELRGTSELALDEPVTHVSWYEANAFARFAGARLPREAEWEKAARDTTLGAALLGRVWQWTADVFAPYPGFEPQPYRDYSVPWFDGRHRVARGGSHLSAKSMLRPTFRNWYLEHVRQPLLGLRLAFDRG